MTVTFYSPAHSQRKVSKSKLEHYQNPKQKGMLAVDIQSLQRMTTRTVNAPNITTTPSHTAMIEAGYKGSKGKASQKWYSRQSKDAKLAMHIADMQHDFKAIKYTING